MKLVNYIAGRYIIYAILILLVAIPVFYFSMQYLLLHSQDETMKDQKEWIEKKLKTTSPENFVSFENSVIVKPSTNLNEFEKLSTEPVFIADDNEMVMHRVLLANVIVNGKPFEIRIQKSMIEDEDLLKSILILQLLLVAILLIGLVIINFKISKKIWKPFKDIVQKLNLYRVDKSGQPDFMATNITEFKDLTSSIKNLTERNSKLYKAQKEFTENASHELQTPIAVMQSKVELLMQTSPISEEQAELIEEISFAGNRMQRLNRTLLFLAKIENNQFPDTEKININNILKKLIIQYEQPALQKNIQLEPLLENNIEVVANPVLLDILIGNILSNAIRHGESGQYVSVKTFGNTLSISNPAKEKLEEQNLFQRFKKQTDNSNSMGLGLEMSKKICNLYNFKIQYKFEGDRHIFSVVF